MLSEETAISKKWKKIFTWLKRFIQSTKKSKKIKYSESIFWEIAKLTKNYTLVLFTKHGVMFNKIFQDNLENDVIVFTDQKKTYNLTKYYKNTQCVLTKKFDNKNISKFYFNNIKKHKSKIFKNNNFAFLITISFPKKGATANSLSLIEKKNI